MGVFENLNTNFLIFFCPRKSRRPIFPSMWGGVRITFEGGGREGQPPKHRPPCLRAWAYATLNHILNNKNRERSIFPMLEKIIKLGKGITI